MTQADEIRERYTLRAFANALPQGEHPEKAMVSAVAMLMQAVGEVAAQLAEHNALTRELFGPSVAARPTTEGPDSK